MKEIPLTKGKVAIIDDEDYDLISRFSWFSDIKIKGGGKTYTYARATLSRGLKKYGIPTKVYMHRLIMDAISLDMQVDHINGNTLDNRKVNLRMCTSCENSINTKSHYDSTSKHKGVSYQKTRGKWVAQLFMNGKRILGKRFDTEQEAADAYNNCHAQHRGHFEVSV